LRPSARRRITASLLVVTPGFIDMMGQSGYVLLVDSRAAYPADAADVLLSGWMRGPETIARKEAKVALTYGKGKVVLLGFRAQHRAQTPGTFPFVFGALYWSTAKSDRF
jgi:hypothetical protein